MSQPSYSRLVTSADDFWPYLSIGQHYAVKRDWMPKVYYHHFMILSYWKRSQLKVIHYAPPEQVVDSGLRAKKRGIIREADYFNEVMKAIKEKKLYLVEKPEYSRFGVVESLVRAKSRLGETAYSVEHNNCEHFVTWCKTGVHASEQCSRASPVDRTLMRFTDSPIGGCGIRHITDYVQTKFR